MLITDAETAATMIQDGMAVGTVWLYQCRLSKGRAACARGADQERA